MDEFAFGAVAQVDDRARAPRDDVAGLADDHGVADQHALALDLDGVVQGGQAHRRPRDLDRLHEGERVTRPVRPTLTRMSSSLVVASSGRVLVGDRPARRPLTSNPAGAAARPRRL